MQKREIRVLLIGEGPQGFSYLANRLGRQGLTCQSATSYEEACRLLSRKEFELVLCPMRLRGHTLYPLIRELHGTRASLFCTYPVEDGCWWLPALCRGQDCFGSGALLPSEFVETLDGLIEELRLEVVAPPPRPRRQDTHNESLNVTVFS